MKRKFRILSFIGIILVVLGIFTPAFAVTVQYTYDSLNRVTKVDYSNGSVEEYTYDAAGNRLTLMASSKGNINGDGDIDLADAILGLQVISGITPSQDVYRAADVNGGGKIGIEEAIYIMQKVSGLR